MPFWTLFGLRTGKATTAWPRHDESAGQEGVLGMPRFDPIGAIHPARNVPRFVHPARSRLTGRRPETYDLPWTTAAASLANSASRPARRRAEASFDWAFGVRIAL